MNGQIEFTIIGQGHSLWSPKGGQHRPQYLEFHAKSEWENLADSFLITPSTTDSSRMEMLNNLDFSAETIVILTRGIVGSTGYSINLERIDEVDSGTVLHVVTSDPDPLEATGDAMQHPFCMVIVHTAKMLDPTDFLVNGESTPFDIHTF